MNTLNTQSIKLKDIILNKQEQYLLDNIIDLFKKTIKNVSETSQTSKIFKKINKLINININIDQQINDIKQNKKDDLKKKKYLLEKIEQNKQEILNLLKQLERYNISPSNCDNNDLQKFINDINTVLNTSFNADQVKEQFIDYYQKINGIIGTVDDMSDRVNEMNTIVDTILETIRSKNSE